MGFCFVQELGKVDGVVNREMFAFEKVHQVITFDEFHQVVTVGSIFWDPGITKCFMVDLFGIPGFMYKLVD